MIVEQLPDDDQFISDFGATLGEVRAKMRQLEESRSVRISTVGMTVGELEVAELRRRERAEADMVIGEIMRKPVTLETTLAARSKEQVEGTISVTFEADAAGNPRKRTRVMKLKIKRPDGVSEDRISTRTVERRLVP